MTGWAFRGRRTWCAGAVAVGIVGAAALNTVMGSRARGKSVLRRQGNFGEIPPQFLVGIQAFGCVAIWSRKVR